MSYELNREASQFCAHVLDVHSTPDSEKYGAISNGTVRIGCSNLLRCIMTGEAKLPRQALIITNGEVTPLDDIIFSLDYRTDFSSENEDVVLLPIAKDYSSFCLAVTRGLVLKSALASKGQYSRVGCFYHERIVDGKSEDVFHTLPEDCKAANVELCSEILEKLEYPGERFVVEII